MQIISANAIKTATNRRFNAHDFAEMRKVRQHRIFPFDRFDQTAYSFRHNGNMRPAPEQAAGRFHVGLSWHATADRFDLPLVGRSKSRQRFRVGAPTRRARFAARVDLPTRGRWNESSSERAMAKKPAPRKRAANSAAASDGASQSPDESPVEYMLRVMRDPKATPSRRDVMAKSATPYVHRKPAPKKKRHGSDASLKKRLESARATLASKISRLRSDGD